MCYLAAPQPTLGHSWGDSLTPPLLISVFFVIFDLKVTGSVVMRLTFQARLGHLVGFKPGTLQFYLAFTHYVIFPKAKLLKTIYLWGHSPQWESVTCLGHSELALEFLYQMIIIKCFSDSLIVYVNDVTTIKTVQRNYKKHFNIHLQSPENIYRSVSCCQELNGIFCKAQEIPINITSVKWKLNYLDLTKEDIDNASFPYVRSLDSS